MKLTMTLLLMLMLLTFAFTRLTPSLINGIYINN